MRAVVIVSTEREVDFADARRVARAIKGGSYEAALVDRKVSPFVTLARVYLGTDGILTTADLQRIEAQLSKLVIKKGLSHVTVYSLWYDALSAALEINENPDPAVLVKEVLTDTMHPEFRALLTVEKRLAVFSAELDERLAKKARIDL